MTDHQPVLKQEVLEALAVMPRDTYVDGTYGRGGHSAGILAALGPEGRLLGLDRDPAAVAAAKQRFGSDPRFWIRQDSFGVLDKHVEDVFAGRKVAGVLLDLGVSSPQLDDGERGFQPVSRRSVGHAFRSE